MSEPIIRAEGLSKRYLVQRREERSRFLGIALKDSLLGTVRRWRQRRDDAEDAQTFWALKDVSFDVLAGEVVGVVGANGAGKSTLLKVLSRITEPTAGRVELRGRVASLLEVGTGFHAELSGRENVYLNGTFLGMRKKEIDARLDAIVDFAGIERFIDTPVKRYSSGMYVRLAFAVAAHLRSEILLVDEILAVGDVAFQRKCLGRIDGMAREGRAVLFVSHNMAAVQRLCTRALLLDSGKIFESSTPAAVVERYLDRSAEPVGGIGFSSSGRRGAGWARVVDFALVDEQGERVARRPADQDLMFDVGLELVSGGEGGSLRGLVLELVLCDEAGRALVSLMSLDDPAVELPDAAECRLRVRLPGPTFAPGLYRVNLQLGVPMLQPVDVIDNALELTVTPPAHPWRPLELDPSRGAVCRRAEWHRLVGTAASGRARES